MGNGGCLVDADIFVFGTGEDIFQNRYAIYSRGSVCHTDHRGKTASCSSQRTGMQVFFICESRIAEMNVGIDQAGGDGKSLNIQSFFVAGGSELPDLGDFSIADTDVCFLKFFCTRIYKLSVFYYHFLNSPLIL